MIQPGLYQHYKGAIVQVLGIAQNCQDADELWVVGIKMGEFGERDFQFSRLRVRPLKDFFELVQSESGDWVPRFRRIDG